MVAWETRAPEPLIPLRFFTNRTRVVSNVASLALLAAFIGYVVLLTWYMQQVLGYSPMRTGLLYLPLGVGIGAGIGLCTALMPRLGVKVMLVVGFLGSAAGLLLASYIHVNSTYPDAILPGLIVFGVFSGICYPGLINGAMHQTTGRVARRCRPGAAAADREETGRAVEPVALTGVYKNRVPLGNTRRS